MLLGVLPPHITTYNIDPWGTAKVYALVAPPFIRGTL